MPIRSKAPKPDAALVYRSLTGFIYRSKATGLDESVPDGARLRGDHEAVVAVPHYFIPDGASDDEIKQRRDEVFAGS